MIDAFGRLAIGGRNCESRSSVKTYLFSIGKNLAAKYMKIRGREQRITYEMIAKALPDDRETPDSIIEREENKR